MLKEVKSYKPRLGVKEMSMEPDGEQVMAMLRAESNIFGSIDLKE